MENSQTEHQEDKGTHNLLGQKTCSRGGHSPFGRTTTTPNMQPELQWNGVNVLEWYETWI